MAAIHFSKDSLRIGLFSILQSFTCTFCSESLAPTRRNRWLSILGMVGSQLAERLASKLGTVFLLARNNHLSTFLFLPQSKTEFFLHVLLGH
jgi:hypothetical protein